MTAFIRSPPPFFYPLMRAAACTQALLRADKEGKGAEIWSLGFGWVLTSPQSLPLKINNKNEEKNKITDSSNLTAQASVSFHGQVLTRLLKIHVGRLEGEGDRERQQQAGVEVGFPYQRPGLWLWMVIKVPRFHLLGQLMKRKKKLERGFFHSL